MNQEIDTKEMVMDINNSLKMKKKSVCAGQTMVIGQ